jgi:hypothetical protein
MIRVADAQLVENYVLRVRFSDGTEGVVDLESELVGPVFDPLRDPVYFGKFRVDDDLHTVVWPNGADFAPEFLYERARVPG